MTSLVGQRFTRCNSELVNLLLCNKWEVNSESIGKDGAGRKFPPAHHNITGGYTMNIRELIAQEDICPLCLDTDDEIHDWDPVYGCCVSCAGTISRDDSEELVVFGQPDSPGTISVAGYHL